MTDRAVKTVQAVKTVRARIGRLVAASGWLLALAAVLIHVALTVLAVTEFTTLGWPLATWFDTGAVTLVLVTGAAGLAASGCAAIRAALGSRALRALIRASGRPVPPVVRAQAVALDCATAIDAIADAQPFAATYGLFRPRILVSTGLAVALTPVEIGAVLAHEREHMRHHDPLRFMIARLFAAWACYFPAAGWLAARTTLRRELAADRAAAGSASRGVLAGALLKLANASASPALTTIGVAGIGADGRRARSLEARVAQLEAGRPPRQRPAVSRLLASAGTLSLLVPASLCCAAMAQFLPSGVL